METPSDGIVLFDKEAGITSHDVVERVRRVIRKGRGFKVGHAGTLDPFATGLLIILLGQATRLSTHVMSGHKVYEAVMCLGVETDTLDTAGKIVSKRNVPDLSTAAIREKAAGFLGEIEQTPPAYSAVRVDGRRAYQWARRGMAVHIKSRKVNIFALDVLWVQLPRIALRIRCSAGTYIRRLAADLGNVLGPGAHLTSLRRVQSGSFHVRDALASQALSDGVPEELWQRVLPLKDAIPDMREIEVKEALARKVRQGYQPVWHELMDEGSGGREDFIKLVNRGSLIAVMKVRHGGGNRDDRVAIDRVFAG